jgi:hypothetical protein
VTNEQFKMLLDLLGKLGSAGYELAYHQAQIEAVNAIIFGVICLILFCVFMAMLKRGFRMMQVSPKPTEAQVRRYGPDWTPNRSDAALTVIIVNLTVGAIGGVLSGAFALSNFQTAILYGLNPGYAALKLLAALVTGS